MGEREALDALPAWIEERIRYYQGRARHDEEAWYRARYVEAGEILEQLRAAQAALPSASGAPDGWLPVWSACRCAVDYSTRWALTVDDRGRLLDEIMRLRAALPRATPPPGPRGEDAR